jgi:glycosyltransferase involved in cell wall biosynthesis
VPKLSVTVVAKNEAADLGAALASVAWADEIVVVDSHSTDDTVAIARQFTDRVVIHDWLGHIEQKNYAASLARHDWILSLDADERVTPALAQDLRTTLTGGEPAHAAFRIPRVTWHLGRWIRSTDWYPDYQDRLYDRRRARWTGRYVHEALAVDGSCGQLRGEIQHYAYRDIADHLETIDRYTTLAARQMHEDGRRAGVLQLAGHAPLAFLRNYIARGGIRDGLPGFVISSMNAYYVLLKFAKLWEIDRVHRSEFMVQGSVPEPRTRNPEPRTPNER